MKKSIQNIALDDRITFENSANFNHESNLKEGGTSV
jgi:hypothetical protein